MLLSAGRSVSLKFDKPVYSLSMGHVLNRLIPSFGYWVKALTKFIFLYGLLKTTVLGFPPGFL